MIIRVDEEGKKTLDALLDIALKTGGLQNLEGTIAIINAVQLIKDDAPEKTEEAPNEKPEKPKLVPAPEVEPKEKDH